jgi:catechol 2,3-dioxygenase-like lactoylglutathione lyase family enzyme
MISTIAHHVGVSRGEVPGGSPDSLIKCPELPHVDGRAAAGPRVVSRRYGLGMINGAHVIIYSRDAEADRSFFRDVLGYPYVETGGGWLIFKLPPAEVAVHPTDGHDAHELFLMCDDVRATVKELSDKGVTFTRPVSTERWGLVTSLRLPGGSELGLYEPHHQLAYELP